jgi:Tfp pilus assembly protein PilP
MMRIVALALLALTLAGCGEDRPRRRRRAADDEVAAGPAAVADGGVDNAVQITRYPDQAFVEAETNRDPFRNYAAMFQVVQPEAQQTDRPVVMADTGIDEMRLIGIITGVADPRAMLIDRNGVGYTVRRGVFLGRTEVVQAGGAEGLPVPLNWRVERIQANQLVLTRDDPTAPNRPPLTRVMPLREDEENERPLLR